MDEVEHAQLYNPYHNNHTIQDANQGWVISVVEIWVTLLSSTIIFSRLIFPLVFIAHYCFLLHEGNSPLAESPRRSLVCAAILHL